jgi:AAA+ superfamily predicted ATPase
MIGSATSRVVNTLLQNLDARAGKGLTIAITNHDALLDTAVWRRFENHIHIELPDAHTRLTMQTPADEKAATLQNINLPSGVVGLISKSY